MPKPPSKLRSAGLRDLPADSELLPQEPSNSDIEDKLGSDLEDKRLRTPQLPESKPKEKETPPKLPKTKRSHTSDETPKPVSTDKIEVLHQSAPYNLQSLRDLYTQVPEQTIAVKRFGANVFMTRGMATRQMPIDLPIGPDYVLGPGDGLTIAIWGGVSLTLNRVVDSEGKLVLPEAGSIVVAGLTLDHAQAFVQGVLGPQFRDAHISISIARLRTIRVYVVGDVQRPGAYDISSLSTPLNALYAAGGPTSVGSLRTVRHFRGENSLYVKLTCMTFCCMAFMETMSDSSRATRYWFPPLDRKLKFQGWSSDQRYMNSKVQSTCQTCSTKPVDCG